MKFPYAYVIVQNGKTIQICSSRPQDSQSTLHSFQEALKEGFQIILVATEQLEDIELYQPFPFPLTPQSPESAALTPEFLQELKSQVALLTNNVTRARTDIRDVARMLDSHHSFSSLAHLETARRPDAHKLDTDLKDNAESAVGLIYQGMVSRISKE